MAVNSYEEATALITALNQVFGLRNFVDPKKDKFKFVCSWIYNILVVSLLNGYYIFGQVKVELEMKFDIHKLLYRVSWIMVVCGYTSIVSVGLYNSKKLLLLTERIKDVDEKFEKLGVNIEYRGFSRRVLITELMWALNLIVSCLLYFKFVFIRYNAFLEFLHAVCYSYIFYISSTVLCDFMVVVYWLGLRFGQLNELLTAFLQNNQTEEIKRDGNTKILVKPTPNYHDGRLYEPIRNSSGVPYLSRESSEKIYSLEQIRLIHLRLCNVSKMLNRIFSVQLLYYVFITLNSIIIILYILYVNTANDALYLMDMKMTILLLTYSMYNTLKIVVVSYCCEHTTGQASKAIEIIHTFSLYEENRDLLNEILQFCLQLSYMHPGKSKSTSFWFNYSFIHQCIGYILTNLILMIQWKDDMVLEQLLKTRNGTS